MSIFFMLAILWWGICGFLAFLAGLWGVLDAIGPKGRIVFVLLLGLLGQWLMARHLDAERRAADCFLTAWAAESADFPEGRINTREIGEFLDFKRLRNVNPYLALHYRMRYHSPVRAAGKETIVTEGDRSTPKTEVYLSDIQIHSSEFDVDFRARIRVWVATDNDRVVQFKFEGIVFL